MILWAAIATTGGPVQNTNRPSTAVGGGVVPSLTPGCRTPRSEEKLFHSASLDVNSVQYEENQGTPP